MLRVSNLCVKWFCEQISFFQLDICLVLTLLNHGYIRALWSLCNFYKCYLCSMVGDKIFRYVESIDHLDKSSMPLSVFVLQCLGSSSSQPIARYLPKVF